MEQRLAAADVTEDMSMDGLIAILFACFGGGVPILSRFRTSPARIASHCRIASSPRRFPERCSRTVPGQCLRTSIGPWDTGFTYDGLTRPQIQTWVSVVRALLKGKRIGCAVEHINDKYTEITTVLNQRLLDYAKAGVTIPPDGPLGVAKAWLRSATKGIEDRDIAEGTTTPPPELWTATQVIAVTRRAGGSTS
jgi:hypothetical protein